MDSVLENALNQCLLDTLEGLKDSVNFALNETYPKAVDENKLFVVNQPNIDIDFNTLDKDKGFTYTATVDVLPAFELGAYKGLEVKKASEKASAKEVKENIERTLKAKAENEKNKLTKTKKHFFINNRFP